MTFFETAGQARVFLGLLYAGIAAGAAYDLMAPLRALCPRALRALPDLIWCLLAAAACALALAFGGEGQLRLYALLGLCCGGGIYCLGLRRAGQGAIALWKKAKKKRGRP